MSDIHFECPMCIHPIDAPKELVSQLIDCPACKEVIEVPLCSQPVGQPKPKPPPKLVVTTGNEVSGHPIKSYLGIARGIVVRSPNIAQGMLGGLKQIVGGNIESFANVCEESRRQAFYRMLDHARAMRAEAIIAMRFDATEFAPGVTEVLAYGTAVTLNNIDGESL